MELGIYKEVILLKDITSKEGIIRLKGDKLIALIEFGNNEYQLEDELPDNMSFIYKGKENIDFKFV